MRALAARLGVVPGALYRHVRNKEQLYDLILTPSSPRSTVRPIPPSPWTEQVTALAHRLRAVPIAGTGQPRGQVAPHSDGDSAEGAVPLRLEEREDPERDQPECDQDQEPRAEGRLGE